MDVKQEFAVRLYRWATRDSIEEMKAGFPLVSRVATENVESYISVMNSLDAANRQHLVTALVKRFHPQAVELLDDGMTPDEEALLEWAVDQRREIHMGANAPAFRVSSRKLRTAVQREVLARTGRKILLGKVGPKTYRFELDFGQWVVHTWVDCGQRPEYFHHIKSSETVLADFLSIASWMGIASVTKWTLKSAGSEKEIAKTMLDASQRFFGALSRLLDGLSSSKFCS